MAASAGSVSRRRATNCDHHAHRDTASLASALAQACPNGIDGDFENVGGRVLDAGEAAQIRSALMALQAALDAVAADSRLRCPLQLDRRMSAA